MNRQSTRILKKDFHQRGCPPDIQVFFHCETVPSNLRRHRHDQDSSNPASAPASSHTSLAQQARETRSECSFVYEETLSLTEIVVCAAVVQGGVIHTTRGLFWRRSSFNFLCAGLRGENDSIPVTVLHGMSTMQRQ